MHTDQARTLLHRIPAIRQPCDLDLLMFFFRHPQTLLDGEQLAGLLGYQPDQVARSLDVLTETGVLTRRHNRARAARMYVFSAQAMGGAPLAAVVELGSTREGRLSLRRALTDSKAVAPGPSGEASPG